MQSASIDAIGSHAVTPLTGLVHEFAGFTRPWAQVGLWISLWNDEGRPVVGMPEPPALWELLRRSSDRFQQALARLARAALASGPDCVELEPHSAIWVMCLPVPARGRAARAGRGALDSPSAGRRSQSDRSAGSGRGVCRDPAGTTGGTGRAGGVVLGCGLATGFRDDENLARFCSLHGLDRIICEHLAAQIPEHPPEVLDGYAGILRSQVEAIAGRAMATRDVQDLAGHLAQAYEELNLIYRLSSHLTVLCRPARHLEEVCRELREVTVVQAFAAVLEGGSVSPSGKLVGGGGLEGAPSHGAGGLGGPQVVRAGRVPASDAELVRLYHALRDAGPADGQPRVINHVEAEPGLQGTRQGQEGHGAAGGGWLRQLAYVPLERQGVRYGGLLALNHVDDGEFGSPEVQLISAVAARSVDFLENVRLYDDLQQLFMGLLHALVSSIDAKDPYTRGHSQRVAWLSRHLAERLGLPAEQCSRVYLSGLLHDVGKIGVSEHVLRKTGRLSEEEFAEMKRHPEIGARILQDVPQIEDLIPGVLEHHERYDGGGYPGGLAGEQISLMGRIIGLADSFDAMTTCRTYRTAHPIPMAIAEIRRWSGTQFDPEMVDVLLRDDPAGLLSIMSDSEKLAAGELPRDAGLASRGRGVGRG